jgi:cyclohexanone monooxygenase
LGDFGGAWYHTGDWPLEPIDFTGKRVAVIGTGSSGIQTIPVVAEQAQELYVFQRTPNFSLPAMNRPLDPAYVEQVKDRFAEDRKYAEHTPAGNLYPVNHQSLFEVDREAVFVELEKRWGQGGFAFATSFSDIVVNPEANEIVAEFVRQKIRSVVHDPEVAALLTPTDHPFATKRLCLDTNYFETFNQPHVTLVDVRQNPIERITADGIVAGGKDYPVDVIIFATGFDAMTGALLKIDIRGKHGLTLAEKWAAGPRTYLGIGTAGFPNLFMLTGPGSPSVLAVVVVAIEQHVNWVMDCIDHLRGNGLDTIEAVSAAEDEWVDHVNQVAHVTLFPQANSWYMGANIPGKPRIFMPYLGGLGVYRKKCDAVADAGYAGFTLSA